MSYTISKHKRIEFSCSKIEVLSDDSLLLIDEDESTIYDLQRNCVRPLNLKGQFLVLNNGFVVYNEHGFKVYSSDFIKKCSVKVRVDEIMQLKNGEILVSRNIFPPKDPKMSIKIYSLEGNLTCSLRTDCNGRHITERKDGNLVFKDGNSQIFELNRENGECKMIYASDLCVVSLHLDFEDNLLLGTYYGEVELVKNNEVKRYKLTDREIYNPRQITNELFICRTYKEQIIWNKEGDIVKKISSKDHNIFFAKNKFIQYGNDITIYSHDLKELAKYNQKLNNVEMLSNGNLIGIDSNYHPVILRVAKIPTFPQKFHDVIIV